MPYSLPYGRFAHSGAYVPAHFGSKMHDCAQVGVRYKFWRALAPSSLMSRADAVDVTRAIKPATVNFIEWD